MSSSMSTHSPALLQHPATLSEHNHHRHHAPHDCVRRVSPQRPEPIALPVQHKSPPDHFSPMSLLGGYPRHAGAPASCSRCASPSPSSAGGGSCSGTPPQGLSQSVAQQPPVRHHHHARSQHTHTGRSITALVPSTTSSKRRAHSEDADDAHRQQHNHFLSSDPLSPPPVNHGKRRASTCACQESGARHSAGRSVRSLCGGRDENVTNGWADDGGDESGGELGSSMGSSSTSVLPPTTKRLLVQAFNSSQQRLHKTTSGTTNHASSDTITPLYETGNSTPSNIWTPHQAGLCDSLRYDSIMCPQGEAVIASCTSSDPSHPPTRHSLRKIVYMTYGPFFWGSRADQCIWLFRRLLSIWESGSAAQILKVLVVLYYILVEGSVEALDILSDRGSPFFDVYQLNRKGYVTDNSGVVGLVYVFMGYLRYLMEYLVSVRQQTDHKGSMNGPILDGDMGWLRKLSQQQLTLLVSSTFDIIKASLTVQHLPLAAQNVTPLEACVVEAYVNSVSKLLSLQSAILDEYFMTANDFVFESLDLEVLTNWSITVARYERCTQKVSMFFSWVSCLHIHIRAYAPPLRVLPAEFVHALQHQLINRCEGSHGAAMHLEARKEAGALAAMERYAQPADGGEDGGGNISHSKQASFPADTVVATPVSCCDAMPLITLVPDVNSTAYNRDHSDSNCPEGENSSLDTFNSLGSHHQHSPTAGLGGGPSRSSTRRQFASSPSHQQFMVLGEDQRCHSASDAQRFRVLRHHILGRGSFGVVFRAWDDVAGNFLACKEIQFDTSAAERTHMALLREYSLLTSLRHRNIVSVVGFAVDGDVGRIFMEWMPSGSMQTVLDLLNGNLRESVVKRLVKDALRGLAFLHGRGVVHRDVKPGNMLLAANGTVKLTDFGSSRVIVRRNESVQSVHMVGTPAYMAPEVVRGHFSYASDIWSLGCSALHMATGRVPWDDGKTEGVGLIFKLGSLTDGQHIPPADLSGLSAGFVRFIHDALTLDHHARPTAADMLRHELFTH